MAKKILFIEDELAFAKPVETILNRQGFEVVLAPNGEIGLAAALSENPDLILLDILLPKITGFEVLEKLKSGEKTKHVPVIILSNLGRDEDIKKGLSLGAENYFVKTRSSSANLIEKIKGILER